MAEMMQCMATSTSDLSVLERQSARLQWQQQEQQQSLNYITGAGNLSNGQSNEALLSFPLSQHRFSSNFQPISEHDPLGGLGLRWPDLSAAGYPVLGFGQGECIGSMVTRKDEGREALATQGCVMAAAADPSPKQSSDNGGINLKKRKAENPPAPKADDCNVEKKSKRDAEAVATMTETKLKEEQTNDNKRETSDESSKGKPKASTAVAAAPQKTDYIHVRARRGQATDSHSLAERVRREKISERMRYLQDLVPGCNKITGKAGMLDEIINYVQSLQRQVEFLSMKLAAVNPRLDFNVDHFFSKEMNPSCSTSISTVGMSCELIDPSYLQLNSLQQAAACCGIDMAMSPPELVLRRSTSSLVAAPDTLLDPCFDVQGSSTWGTDLHSLYNVEFHQAKGAAFPLQSFHGNLLPNNLKMEM